LPFQAVSFAFIPFNKQTNSFDYSKYKDKLEPKLEEEANEINKKLQENGDLTLQKGSDKELKDILSSPSSNDENKTIGDELEKYMKEEKEKNNTREIYSGNLNLNQKTIETLKKLKSEQSFKDASKDDIKKREKHKSSSKGSCNIL